MLVRCLSVLLLGCGSDGARGDEESSWAHSLPYYHRTYVLLGVNQALPRGVSAEKFAPGKLLPTLAYRYYHSEYWVSGIGGNYLHMPELPQDLGEAGGARAADRGFALARVYFENSVLLRVYFPVYLSFGYRFFYLYPLQPPLTITSRNDRYSREFGAGALLACTLFAGEDYLLQLSAERWRGLNSARLQGLEFALALGRKL